MNYFQNLNGQTRVQAVEKYRELLLRAEIGYAIDFDYINKKIIERWSIAGLEFIKKKAWLEKSNHNRTWIVAKNTKSQWCVGLISVKDFYATGCVGFSSYAAAAAHMNNIISYRR